MRNRKRARAWYAAGFWAIGIGSALPTRALDVRLTPASLVLGPGEAARVEVRVEGVPAPGLAAFQLDVSFDPAVAEVLDPNRSGVLVEPFAPLGGDPNCSAIRGAPSCPDPDWFLTVTGRVPLGVDLVDNIGGRLTLAYATSGVTLPPKGSGVVALLDVVGTGGGTANLNVSNVILGDNGEPPMRLPEPGALGMALATLLSLWRWRWRSKRSAA